MEWNEQKKEDKDSTAQHFSLVSSSVAGLLAQVRRDRIYYSTTGSDIE